MAMAANDIERLIKARIPDADVTIRDLAGDGDHYAATVISETFRGKSRVQQHQIVYEALKGEMGGALHALALQTSVPEARTPDHDFGRYGSADRLAAIQVYPLRNGEKHMILGDDSPPRGDRKDFR